MSLPVLADPDDILLFIPPIIASVQCDADDFSACQNPTGCRLINGVWASGVCTAKPANQLATEKLAGLWATTTTFSNGVFFNYLSFDAQTVARIANSADFLIEGRSHSSSSFSDASPNYIVGTYDSFNQDWFVLDYWGLDIGLISSFEVVESGTNGFVGCEFVLNYPDLTYRDGVCNPMTFKSTVATLNDPASLTNRKIDTLRANTAGPMLRKSGTAYRPQARALINSITLGANNHE